MVKPIAIMKYLVNMFSTPDGGTVYDPFMGSGTTGIACKILDRDFIGSEIDKDYFEIDKARIAYDWEAWEFNKNNKEEYVRTVEHDFFDFGD